MDIKEIKRISELMNGVCSETNCEDCEYREKEIGRPYTCRLDEGEALSEAVRIIEEQEERIAIMSEGGWHDAEKDPPEETDCYIVRIDFGIGQMTTMREYVSSEGRWLMSREEKITHWMPFPEPPKEGEADG